MNKLKIINSVSDYNPKTDRDVRITHTDLSDLTVFDTPAKKSNCFFTGEEHQTLRAKDYNVIYNPDTNLVYGVVGSDYKLVNHAEVFEPITNKIISEFGTNIEVIDTSYDFGKFASRKFIFNDINANLNANRSAQVDDIIKASYTLFNGIGGNKSLGGLHDAYRLACLNGQMSVEKISRMFFRHTKNLDLDYFVNLSHEVNEKFNQLFIQQEIMSTKDVTFLEARNILETTIAKSRTNKKNEVIDHPKMDVILNQFLKETNNLGYSLYAFYNALTYWYTHIDSSKGSIYSTSNSRLNDLYLVFNSPSFKNIYAQ